MSVPGIEERRAAADRLRALGGGGFGWAEIAGAVAGEPCPPVAVAGALADLIDPAAWEFTCMKSDRLFERNLELERALITFGVKVSALRGVAWKCRRACQALRESVESGRAPQGERRLALEVADTYESVAEGVEGVVDATWVARALEEQREKGEAND